MTTPSVTYTFVNGTTASATEVNTNFQNLIDAMTDGAKDFTIFTLTCGSTATFNGNVTLGNSSSDDLTITASLASSIAIKTTNTYNVGSSTLGLASIYLGANSQTVRVLGSGSMSATWALTLPVSAGVAGQGLQTNGSGVTSWQPMQTDINSVSSAGYTVLDSDGYRTILVNTGGTNRTVTLPTAADNTDRVIEVKKTDSATNTVTVDGEGAETIDGATTYVLRSQYQSVRLVCDGSGWHVVSSRDIVRTSTSVAIAAVGGTWSSNPSVTFTQERIGNVVTVHVSSMSSITKATSNGYASFSGALSDGYKPTADIHVAVPATVTSTQTVITIEVESDGDILMWKNLGQSDFTSGSDTFAFTNPFSFSFIIT